MSGGAEERRSGPSRPFAAFARGWRARRAAPQPRRGPAAPRRREVPALGSLSAAGLALGCLAALAAESVAARSASEQREALYPEGPVVIDGALFVAEMTADRVIRLTRDDEAPGGLAAEVFFARPGCGPTALAEIAGDRRVILCHLEGALAIVEASGALTGVIAMSADGVRLDSPNDVSADGAGGAIFSNAGIFAPGAAPRGRVMRLAPDLTVTTLAEGLAYANGVAVDKARDRVLVSEHLARRVLAFPLAPDGGLGPPEIFVSRAEIEALAPTANPLMGPDGIEIMPDGTVLIALYGARRYLRRAPDGDLRASIINTPFLTNLTIWDDALVLVGAFDNRNRPYPGLVELRPSP